MVTIKCPLMQHRRQFKNGWLPNQPVYTPYIHITLYITSQPSKYDGCSPSQLHPAIRCNKPYLWIKMLQVAIPPSVGLLYPPGWDGISLGWGCIGVGTVLGWFWAGFGLIF